VLGSGPGSGSAASPNTNTLTPGSTTLGTVSNSVSAMSAEEMYTLEFTRTCLGWMKKHLNEIIPGPASASATTASAASVSAGECLLDDEGKRKVWVEKWEYMQVHSSPLPTLKRKTS
jgi:hypothetical protein